MSKISNLYSVFVVRKRISSVLKKESPLLPSNMVDAQQWACPCNKIFELIFCFPLLIISWVHEYVTFYYSHHWVLRPPSVRGVEVAKASAAAKARVWTLGIATRWLLKQGSGYLFLFLLGLATTTAAILLYKSQILRLLNPRLLFMY